MSGGMSGMPMGGGVGGAPAAGFAPYASSPPGPGFMAGGSGFSMGADPRTGSNVAPPAPAPQYATGAMPSPSSFRDKPPSSTGAASGAAAQKDAFSDLLGGELGGL